MLLSRPPPCQCTASSVLTSRAVRSARAHSTSLGESIELSGQLDRPDSTVTAPCQCHGTALYTQPATGTAPDSWRSCHCGQWPGIIMMMAVATRYRIASRVAVPATAPASTPALARPGAAGQSGSVEAPGVRVSPAGGWQGRGGVRGEGAQLPGPGRPGPSAGAVARRLPSRTPPISS